MATAKQSKIINLEITFSIQLLVEDKKGISFLIKIEPLSKHKEHSKVKLSAFRIKTSFPLNKKFSEINFSANLISQTNLKANCIVFLCVFFENTDMVSSDKKTEVHVKARFAFVEYNAVNDFWSRMNTLSKTMHL